MEYVTEQRYIEKGVQVNLKPTYRSKATNTKIDVKHTAVSPFKEATVNVQTSPQCCLEKTKAKRILDFSSAEEESSSQKSDDDYDDESYVHKEDISSGSAESYEDKVANEELQNTMRNATVMSMERNPKIFLGLPQESYFLIDLLSEKLQITTLNIVITLKKIRLNDSFAILAIHFGMSE